MDFERQKEAALCGLETAKSGGLVDDGAISIIDAINSVPCFYTTSSCSGRIVVSEATPDNKKKSYEFLGKWHCKLKKSDARKAISKHKKDVLWLRLDPLILHVCCKDIESAGKLLFACQRTGLKRSGIYQTEPRIIVEIMGVDSISAPLGKDGNVFASEEQIKFLVRLANSKLDDNKKKMRELEAMVATIR